jgi:hypothetical protein
MPSEERYDLLMLRGECLLRVDQRATAVDAFSQAERSAVSPEKFAMARASALVVKATPNNRYTPRGRNAGPELDIFDPASRKLAFAAVRQDRLRTLAPQLERAQSSTTLPPMLEVLSPMLDIAALEYAAQGNAADTRQILTDLGTRARGLIGDELRRIDARLNALEDASNSATTGGFYVSRRGLYSNEAAEVRQAVEYLGQIEKVARDVRQRAQRLGWGAEAWEPIIADTGDLTNRAQAMLNIVP